MFKIERVEEKMPVRKRFSFRQEYNFNYCAFYVTLFGRTYRIKYSTKLNYFFIANQTKKQRFLLDALAQSFVQLSLKSEGLNITRLERLQTAGHCTDFFYKGVLDGQDVFLKVIFAQMQDILPVGETVLKNEYEKGMVCSAGCRHFLKPLHYIHNLPCEILITPYLENIRSLRDIFDSGEKPPVWIDEQLKAAGSFLKSKRIAHRDIYVDNVIVANIKGQEPQVYLVDLTFTTYLDEDGKPIPLAIEPYISKVQEGRDQPDDFKIADILNRLEMERRK